ncbi:MAG: hypothetical protein LAP87_30410, partial [Acidobacteriia bacterium]|nr:hypothetical protein [Terriglobia bacterium]
MLDFFDKKSAEAAPHLVMKRAGDGADSSGRAGAARQGATARGRKLDRRSLNSDTFNSIYVLVGHALPEEAQFPPVQRAGGAQAGVHPQVSNRGEMAYPSGSVLLDSRSGQSDGAIAWHHYGSRGTVVLCIQKFLQFGLDAALGE